MIDIEDYLMQLASGELYPELGVDERFIIGHALGMFIGINQSLRQCGAPQKVIDGLLEKASSLTPLFAIAHTDAIVNDWFRSLVAPNTYIH